MLNFFSTIAESIGLLLQFLGNTISGLLQAIAIAFHSFGWLTVALGYMPSVLMGFAFMGLLLTFLFFILGR